MSLKSKANRLTSHIWDQLTGKRNLPYPQHFWGNCWHKLYPFMKNNSNNKAELDGLLKKKKRTNLLSYQNQFTHSFIIFFFLMTLDLKPMWNLVSCSDITFWLLLTAWYIWDIYLNWIYLYAVTLPQFYWREWKLKQKKSLTHSGNLLRGNNFMIVYMCTHECVTFSQ